MSKTFLLFFTVTLITSSCGDLTQKVDQKLDEVNRTKKSIDSLVDESTKKVDSLSNKGLRIVE